MNILKATLVIGVIALLFLGSGLNTWKRTSEVELRTGAVRTTVTRFWLLKNTTYTEVPGRPLSSVPTTSYEWRRLGCTRFRTLFGGVGVSCGRSRHDAMNSHQWLARLLDETNADQGTRTSAHDALGNLLMQDAGWFVTFQPIAGDFTAIYAEDYEGNRVSL